MKLKVLVIDDEKTILQTFKLRLTKWGHEVFLASEGTFGLNLLSETDCNVVITDLKMPGLPGQDVVKLVKENHPATEVVVITGYATVESAVEVMKIGASDFLVKPLDFDHVRIVLDKIAQRLLLVEENKRLKDSIGTLRNEAGERYKIGNLVGKSKSMRSVFNMIDRVAPLESTVLLYGETGTGKEMVAKAIHHNSPRKSGPMVTVDCGSLSETLLESELFGHTKGAFTGAHAAKKGRFEQAQNGTIFLDEVNNASQVVQKKLLRVIQEKSFQRLGGETPVTVDVRIVAATNKDLQQLVKKGEFRRDLFYRLNVVPIWLPPLRDRIEDIPLLTRHFIEIYTIRMDRGPIEISSDAMKELVSYSWPGNIRELSNVIERTIIMTSGNTISKFYINGNEQETGGVLASLSLSLDPPLKEQIAVMEFNYLKLALKRYHGRIKNVAERSGLNPRTLYRKMKYYGLEKRKFD